MVNSTNAHNKASLIVSSDPDWLTIMEENNGADKASGEVPIRRLKPGDRFDYRLPTGTKHWLGTLIGLRLHTAVVVFDGRETEKYYQTREGKEVVLRLMGGIEYVPAGMPVKPLGETRDISRWKADKAGAIRDNHPEDGDSKTKKEKEEEEQMAKVANLAKAVNDDPPITGQVKERKVGAVKVKAVKELHECLCGCGEMVTGRFRMGHDGRYYGLLNRVINDKIKFNELPEKMQREVKTKANAEKIVAEHYHKVTKN